MHITSATLDIDAIRSSLDLSDYEIFAPSSQRTHSLTVKYSPVTKPADREQRARWHMCSARA
jgi:hypothetical protein